MQFYAIWGIGRNEMESEIRKRGRDKSWEHFPLAYGMPMSFDWMWKYRKGMGKKKKTGVGTSKFSVLLLCQVEKSFNLSYWLSGQIVTGLRIRDRISARSLFPGLQRRAKVCFFRTISQFSCRRKNKQVCLPCFQSSSCKWRRIKLV